MTIVSPRRQELTNTLTHGVGAVLSLILYLIMGWLIYLVWGPLAEAGRPNLLAGTICHFFCRPGHRPLPGMTRCSAILIP